MGMEFINYYADVGDRDSDSEAELRENKEGQDNTEIENNPSDYYGLLNITRNISDCGNDPFLETDLEGYRNKDSGRN